MISDSWITQNENVQKFVWNISIFSIYGRVHSHQNTKQIFVEFPETKDTKPLKQQQQFFLECIDLIIVNDPPFKYKPTNISIICIGFI